MMNTKKIIFRLLLLPLVFNFTACTSDDLPDKGESGNSNVTIVNNSTGALKGQIIVKFRPEISKMLDEAQVTRSVGPHRITRVGINTVDELLDLISAYELERIFPVDKSTEERTRQSGLHLWYTVYFDENMELDRVAKDLSQLGELSKIEFTHEVKRNWSGRAKPVSQQKVRSVASRNNMPFNDPELKNQWHYINRGEEFLEGAIAGADVNCLEAWEVCKGDPSIVVAVMDEGIDWAHPDLNANMWTNENEIYRSNDDNDGNGYIGDYYGYNFCRDSGIISCDDPADTGHGTHVAGTVAAVNGNGIGVCGIAGGDGTSNSGVKLMSLQIFSGAVGSTNNTIAKAAKYAADNGAVILQCSWGFVSGFANPIDWGQPGPKDDDEYERTSTLLKESFDYFIYNAGSPNGVIDGGVIIFAAGNESARGAAYPAAFGDYISVAAMAGDYSPASYTNYDFGVDITAPGGDNGRHQAEEGGVLSTIPTHMGEYGYMEGTSMSCPHVSGVAALGLSYATKLHKHFRANDYKDLIVRSVRPINEHLTGSRLFYYGWSLGVDHPTLVDISTFRGKMGSGVSDAGILLSNIAQGGVGTQLVLPNVYVAVNAAQTISLTHCFKNGELSTTTFQASSDDASIATVRIEGNRLVVEGKKVGRCGFTVTASDGEAQKAFITVREKTSDNGWL